MEIVVRGRHFDVPEKFRDYAVERLQDIPDHGHRISRIDVEVTRENNPRQADQAMEVELTCIGRGPVVRAEYAAHDKFVALDSAVDRLVDRLRRSADRRRTLARNGARHVVESERAEAAEEDPSAAVEPPVDADREAELARAPGIVYAEGPVLVREKTHQTVPMTVEQALEAMELVGHDFYLFQDIGTGEASLVYCRRGYDYGLIRLEVTAADAESAH